MSVSALGDNTSRIAALEDQLNRTSAQSDNSYPSSGLGDTRIDPNLSAIRENTNRMSGTGNNVSPSTKPATQSAQEQAAGLAQAAKDSKVCARSQISQLSFPC